MKEIKREGKEKRKGSMAGKKEWKTMKHGRRGGLQEHDG